MGRRNSPEMCFLLAVVMATRLAEGARQPSSLLDKAPYYHISGAIHEELIALSTNCSGASLTLETLQSAVPLQVATISSIEPGTVSNPPLRAFLLFGEHARELVAAESGLDLVRTMCGSTGNAAQQQLAQSVLKRAQVKVVVNANPAGRMQVEAGSWCHRGNGHGVDLNRNWDVHFKEGKGQIDSYPGPAPFSEAETWELQDLLEDWQPQLFLTVHSGSRMLAFPHGYPSPNETENMLEAAWKPAQQKILQPIADKYCPDCAITPLATSDLGYAPAGTSMDYAFDKLHAHFSFLWEIYDGRRSQTQTAFLSDSTGKDEHAMPCFPMFNPTSRTTLAAVVNTWTSAYLDLIQAVAMQPQGNPEAVPTQSPHNIKMMKLQARIADASIAAHQYATQAFSLHGPAAW
eukprot:gnl/MRDRNA2_/MRDRNA2_122820_c0_seq1.p1 gnl/MRDRNA2_/MRDRNA2_122820_c0~~gnl/MRDRNA2_/MRDRNA2_122820_c0_seq1.p1  ORF type:complete len:404 (-),score=63.27 gnl/MRDRNA2_/MRDRNA2_122820_c0_seq1:143-1354(-)